MPETPEQERQRVAYSIAALSNGITIGKRRSSAIEKRVAEETERLQTALDQEQAKTAALEKRIREQELETDLTARQHEQKIETVSKSVEDLDVALGAAIRQARAPRVKKHEPIRDEVGRVSEILITEDGSDTAVVRRVIRDASYRIVGTEDYVVPVEDAP